MDKATVKQAMEATINLLKEISVPISMTETITRPIVIAINNLSIGLKTMEDNETETAEVREDGNADVG